MNKHLSDWEWLLRDLDSIVGVMSRISWLRRFTALIRQDQQREILKEIKPLIKLPTTKEQQEIYDKFISKKYYPHAFGCEKFDDGKCNCGYESAD